MKNHKGSTLLSVGWIGFVIGFALAIGYHPSTDNRVTERHPVKTSKEKLLALPFSELEKILRELVSEEKYEDACLVRDLIKEKKGLT